MKTRRSFAVLGAIVAVIFAGVSVSIKASRGAPSESTVDDAPPAVIEGPPPALVETVEVKSMTWQSHKNVMGVIKAAHYLDVRTEVAGTILQVAPPGSRVAANAMLFHIDDRAERAELRQKEANLEMERLNAHRADVLVNSAMISKADQQAAHVNLEQAISDKEELRSQLRKMTIKAPFPGVVSLHDLAPGQSSQAGQTLFSLYDPDRLYVEFSVPEADISTLVPGVKVTLNDSISAYNGTATVTLVNSEVNSKNRTLTLRANVIKGQFRHGSSVRVAYPSMAPLQSLVIPKVAVNYSAYGQSVFVVQNHRVQLRSVVTGDERDGLVQVLQGLDANEIVVTAGQIRLYPDAPVRLENKP